MHALFSACSLRDNNAIISKPTWKPKHANYSRAFWIFLPNIIKIYPYHFELYRCKVGPFFETQCSGKRVALNTETVFCKKEKKNSCIQQKRWRKRRLRSEPGGQVNNRQLAAEFQELNRSTKLGYKEQVLATGAPWRPGSSKHICVKISLKSDRVLSLFV